ncbi:MAG: hypothetical protein A3C50_00515 [Candidatus Staskawiczbacteria bacterium RIFCSPHIGHO2_02_FULL_43_16]|uniref:Uncharacterized protein n=1 Tax=Candidatus Staskawiczbacteria bacterium RIFCSPHIGHO2_01_FULL_41_41 TaxID=1802203 RepID=A0A1G2HSS7_9BACT|nr:MAG: hypothetical protein A2822_04380 [Candidatus Staskawiczbacteria bacterium RIFCSPHIGHO2_01_FULL_41_41]OGZ68246.1 MAG: hypothetical protein A3C50_00515 [Candidatus Staskawiczbacteria bacterium RIFCSPHIGHO2_02_FULL_43_16]OGZ74634.1 MAG: hypothetical protein A3A12_00610 [Candidatus Staskawiczbacteria bacterium RIFCSPLOWO2_01_FULL_43_17b]
MALKVSAIKIGPKENSNLIAWCDRVIKNTIYVLVFAIPIFFTPWTYSILDFNKQALLLSLSFVALAAWMLKTLLSGRFTVKITNIHIAMGSVVLVWGLATIFSVAKTSSFFGIGQFSSQAFVSVLAFATIYFLVSNTFLQKDIEKSFSILGISTALVLAYGLLQMFGLHIIPLNFARATAFNSIGSLGSLGFFAVVLLPLWVALAPSAKRWWQVLYVVNIILTLLVLVIINYQFLWALVLAGSLLLIIFWTLKKDIFDVRWMFLPVFFFIVSLFFLLLTPQIKWLPQNSLEVSLSNRANVEMNIKALQSFEFFGAGPNNFAYDFAKYKNIDFNQSPLWNVNFTSGASKVLTAFTEVGIVGLVAMLVLMALGIFYGAKYFLAKDIKDIPQTTRLTLVVVAVVAVETLGYFLYNANIPLDFMYFFSLACLVALVVKPVKEYVLASSSLVTMAAIFVFVLLFIFDVGVLFVESQRYLADMDYRKGLVLFSQDKKSESLQYFKMAAKNGNWDVYYNQLALFSLVSVRDYLSTTGAPDKEAAKQAVQSLIADAISASNASVALNPQNYDNWSTRGYVCQNLLELSPEAFDCAMQSYDKAIALNPNNPYLYLQQGNSYLVKAANATDTFQRSDLLSKANDKINKAIDLKANYALAHLQLSVVLKLHGNTSESLAALQEAEKYSTTDATLSFQVGLNYYQDKNWSKAQDNFQRALRLVGQYANALYFSGLAYEKSGQKESAISQFSKLLELNTKTADVQKIIANIQAGRPALDGVSSQPPAPVDAPASNQNEGVVAPVIPTNP